MIKDRLKKLEKIGRSGKYVHVVLEKSGDVFVVKSFTIDNKKVEDYIGKGYTRNEFEDFLKRNGFAPFICFHEDWSRVDIYDTPESAQKESSPPSLLYIYHD
ncbi:MAG: hypothetical protein LWX07_04185 [Bacteroidetes bacterium]|nr:hypothetical protein [Bacteroidota bacterium]